jgi:histidinol phosphatase-like enzyme
VDLPGYQPCAFFDRDGVFNDTEGVFVDSPRALDVALRPEAVAAVAALTHHLPVIGISNQAAIDRGRIDPARARAIWARLARRVEEAGGVLGLHERADPGRDEPSVYGLAAFYYCPNAAPALLLPGELDASKPSPGMYYRAARDFEGYIDLANGAAVGDMTMDVKAAQQAHPSMKTFLVETGYAGADGKFDVTPDEVVPDAAAAAQRIRETLLP